MKKIQQLQKEFIKLALKWNELSVEQQRKYLKLHPKSKKRLTAVNDTEKSINLLSSIIKKSPFKNKTFVCGGYVRDKILGKPSKDIDITVEALNGGIDLATYISEKLGIREPVIFPTFGTAKIQLPNGLEVEFVQTRNEEYAKGSRKPRTSFGTLLEDVERRDFTVNTLLEDLTTREILDLTGKGVDDLKQGIIRTPLDPDITFQDDPLRMLRAIRFATKYNFKFADDILPALEKNAAGLDHISKERIHDELNKILATNTPSRAFNVMLRTGLLNYVIPELSELKGLQQGKYHYTDAWGHTMHVLDASRNKLDVRMAALLHDIGKPRTLSFGDDNEPHFYTHEKVSGEMAKDILKRLKYDNDFIDDVSNIVSMHMRIRGSSSWSTPAVRRFIRDTGDNLEQTLDLVEADRKGHDPAHSDLSTLKKLRERIENIQKQKPVKDIVSPLSGEEIMQLLGLKQGPDVGKVKSYISDLMLENPDLTKEQIVEKIKKFKLS